MSNKISLCMIVGNVEEYIERCLNSFFPIADEVCIVRAIGNQKPDSTMEKARAMCESRGVPLKVGTYENAPGHDWPHVDSFAAARQMSFDLASHDYCFWCDTDDVLKQGVDLVRKHANDGSFAAYLFPYEIVGKGVTVPRERLVRKDSGKWKYAVHECFKFHVEPVVGAQDDGVIVQHLPHLSKTGSNDRNLRILESIPKDELTVGLRYHLFQELIGIGDREAEAMAVGEELLLESELGKDERYDMLLTLTLHTEDIGQRKQLLHVAHMVDPCRREALGTLACISMDGGDGPAAMAYARQMVATTIPHDECWNSRRSFYGYVGDEIYQQALRFNGQLGLAENVRLDGFKRHGMPRISLLHATRGRPQQAAKCRKRWFDLAEKPELIEHIFAIDDDDRQSDVLRRFHHITSKDGGCVAAWNAAANVCNGDILVQLSDDWTPVPHWDKLIMERIGASPALPLVLAISDGARKDDLLCMAICTRGYYTQDYYLFHPWFTGVYSDNWFTFQAYKRGQVVEARDIVFTHSHPVFGTAPMDETYSRQNSPARYEEGAKIYATLQEQKDWSTVPGFFNYWQFYQQVIGKLKDGDTVVEVGSWLGRSVIYLAQEAKRQGKRITIHAVDTFKGEANQPAHYDIVNQHGGSVRKAFEANLKRCGVDDMVKVIEGDSAESAALFDDGSLAFCYIDAAHDYESVKRDVKAWKPKVRAGGLLAGHDAHWHEVKQAVKELIPSATFTEVVWLA